ncbi:Metal-nicotianamine transporter ysl3 [Thalictrum thalictroides]|uniref:Metal-nicotianamine transporter ysl3 n=1 Tax=Thalictrum thalictroides TaxID=46969 RepID=A0A7J6W573_THATH|nr:Metal-nicotianamine transporter ysl3 [Thalictrum thalictroides]
MQVPYPIYARLVILPQHPEKWQRHPFRADREDCGFIQFPTFGLKAYENRSNLAACGVMMNIVSTASDLMQDFKTGYMTLVSPKSMFVSQAIGTAMGCVISPSVFYIFLKAFKNFEQPGSEYPAPYALVYCNMAILGVEGVIACSLILFVWQKLERIKADAFGAGLICGDGICTKFLSRN